ncbi:hypothetical protein ABBQ32_011443 [Trebouxia sp. C0010 RCD-2024]
MDLPHTYFWQRNNVQLSTSAGFVTNVPAFVTAYTSYGKESSASCLRTRHAVLLRHRAISCVKNNAR